MAPLSGSVLLVGSLALATAETPLRGIAYGALPCTDASCGGRGLPSEDMVQSGYNTQWGAHGRDDLGAMRSLGANAVRLYHSMGLGVQADHGEFLGRALDVGVGVLAGYHTETANNPDECPGYDCYDSWRRATLSGLGLGMQSGTSWHPAVKTLILLNEPDFFHTAPQCRPMGDWCRVKAAISALDGVLAAEREANLTDTGRVKLTITWSFGMRTSIDGKVTGPGTFGFQDMKAAVADPSIAKGYTPRSSVADLQAAYTTRWVNGLNTQAPWDFVRSLLSAVEADYPVPWFIGEYGANGQPASVITADLQAMDVYAGSPDNQFWGAAFFQFQTAYWKGGSEMNFGLFGLGDGLVGSTGPVCGAVAEGCAEWPVHCLTSELSWLPGDLADRASAVAAAWGGSLPTSAAHGMCEDTRRLRGR